MQDLSVASSMGYGQSKLISERLLDEAARVSGVGSAVCRVGIIAGPVERPAGMWSKHEYIPSVSFPFIYFCESLFESKALTPFLKDHRFVGTSWGIS